MNKEMVEKFAKFSYLTFYKENSITVYKDNKDFYATYKNKVLHHKFYENHFDVSLYIDNKLIISFENYFTYYSEKKQSEDIISNILLYLENSELSIVLDLIKDKTDISFSKTDGVFYLHYSSEDENYIEEVIFKHINSKPYWEISEFYKNNPSFYKLLSKYANFYCINQFSQVNSQNFFCELLNSNELSIQSYYNNELNLLDCIVRKKDQLDINIQFKTQNKEDALEIFYDWLFSKILSSKFILIDKLINDYSLDEKSRENFFKVFDMIIV